MAVADEMESFLFILIYYAVRYLTSTIARDMDAASFIDQCYDVYSLWNSIFDSICTGRPPVNWAIVSRTSSLLAANLDETGDPWSGRTEIGR